MWDPVSTPSSLPMGPHSAATPCPVLSPTPTPSPSPFILTHQLHSSTRSGSGLAEPAVCALDTLSGMYATFLSCGKGFMLAQHNWIALLEASKRPSEMEGSHAPPPHISEDFLDMSGRSWETLQGGLIIHIESKPWMPSLQMSRAPCECSIFM